MRVELSPDCIKVSHRADCIEPLTRTTLAYSLTHSLVNSLIHSLTHPLTHSPTHLRFAPNQVSHRRWEQTQDYDATAYFRFQWAVTLTFDRRMAALQAAKRTSVSE